jgi:hypothetical protein
MADNNRNRGNQSNQDQERNDKYFDSNYYGSAGAYNTSYNSQYGQDDKQNQYGSQTNRRERNENTYFGDREHRDRSYGGNQGQSSTAGGNKGKGPKGYHRSEERIREDAYERLTYDDRVDASDIDIQVQGEDLILTGTVSSKEEKRRAEDIVENISGIRNVENRIRVGHSNEPSGRGSMGNATGSSTGTAMPSSTSATFGSNMTTSTESERTSGSETTGSRRGRNKKA